MAFAFGTSSLANLSSATTITLAHTCTAGTRLLVMGLATRSTTIRTGGAPTYNSVTMAQIQTAIAGSAECTAELWYLANPDTGSSYNISVPNANATTERVVASNYTNDATIYLQASTSTTNSTANPTLTLNSVAQDSLVVDILGDGRADVPSANTGGTVLTNNDEGAWVDSAQYKITTSSGNVTFTWVVANDDVAFIMASFSTVAPIVATEQLIMFM